MLMKEIYTLSQDELREFVKKFLKDKGIEFKEYDGNIWSIRNKGKVCFVSHLDTVAHSYVEYKKPVFEANGILFKVDAILGADDRAGVNLILNHCEDINFIFTRDEEIGRLGASSLAENVEFLQEMKNNVIGFIELDRKNYNDIIGYRHGYCDKDFHDAVSGVLTDSIDALGAYTDIDEFIEDKPAVNISVAYFNAHTKDEYLDIKAWEELDKKILLLNEIQGEFKIAPPKTYYSPKYTTYSSKYYKNTYDFYDDYYNDIYGIKGISKKKPTVKEMLGSINQDIISSNQYFNNDNNKLLSISNSMVENVIRFNEDDVQLVCSECGDKIEIGEEYSALMVSTGEIQVYHSDCFEDLLSEKV